MVNCFKGDSDLLGTFAAELDLQYEEQAAYKREFYTTNAQLSIKKFLAKRILNKLCPE